MKGYKSILKCIMSFILIISILLANTYNTFAFIPDHAFARLRNTIVVYIGSPEAYVNRTKTLIDTSNNEVKPVVVNGRTLVPIRFIAEAMGAEVLWDDTSFTATIKYDKNEIKLTLGSSRMYINGNNVELATVATEIEGRLFIPLRALVEGLGKEVFYHDGLIIISDIKEIYEPSRDMYSINSLIELFQKDDTIDALEEAILNRLSDWEFEEALVLIDELIELSPELPIGYFYKGLVFSALRNNVEVELSFEKAVELDNHYVPALNGLGIIKYQMGFYEEAIEIFNRIIKLVPTYEGALLDQAALYIYRHRYEEALAILDQAIELDPYYVYNYYDLKARALSGLGRHEEALNSIDEAILRDDDYFKLYIDKGVILNEMGRHQEALDNLDIAIDLSLHYKAFSVKAEILFKIGEYEEYIKVVNRLLSLYPKYEADYVENIKIAKENLRK